jgi:hypothetical protein
MACAGWTVVARMGARCPGLDGVHDSRKDRLRAAGTLVLSGLPAPFCVLCSHPLYPRTPLTAGFLLLTSLTGDIFRWTSLRWSWKGIPALPRMGDAG